MVAKIIENFELLFLYKKTYKSHCKTFENKHSLAVAFFAFWAIRSIAVFLQEFTCQLIY